MSKKAVPKFENQGNNYLFCNKCNTILGFELKNEQNNDNYYSPTSLTIANNNNNNYYYFLKKNIKQRYNKTVVVNLISFKENLLKNIKDQLDNIFSEIQNINIQINLTQITKQNFEDFSKFYKKKEFDYTFIVHKLEGRIFLLGKNGYFNSVEENLTIKQNSNLYFILVSNEIEEKNNQKIIEELIEKGGEEKLEKYYLNDRIIFLDNYQLQNDIDKKKQWFINKINEIYGDNDLKNKYYIKCEKNIYISDKRKIDNMIDYMNSKGKNNGGCFS